MTDTTAVDRDVDDVKAAVLAAAKTMYARGLVSGTAGNVSGRLDTERAVLTPSSLGYEEMTLDDLVIVDLDGEVLEGHRSATSEKALHLECLRAYPEVGGVVHCHATHASMFAVARQPIPAAIDEFVVYIGGDVPVAEYQPSGSDELAHSVVACLGDRSAALMANHGMVCIGKSVDDALHSALVVEHNAEIMWGSMALSGPVALPRKVIDNFNGIYDFVRNHMWAG